MWFRARRYSWTDGPTGRALQPDVATLEPYEVPVAPPGGWSNATHKKTGEVPAPLTELLRLGGVGAAVTPLDRQVEHWRMCGACPACERLERAVYRFAAHWGLLGFARLTWLGYRHLGEWRDAGAFGDLMDLQPVWARPEPVALFLEGAVLLWRWWRRYSAPPFPPTPADERWFELLFGRTPAERQQEVAWLTVAFQRLPEMVPRGMTPASMANRVSDRLTQRTTATLERTERQLQRLLPVDPSDRTQAGIDRAVQRLNSASLDGAIGPAGRRRSLAEQVSHVPRAQLQLLMDDVLAVAALPDIGPGWEAATTRIEELGRVKLGDEAPPLHEIYAPWADAYRHPGLNEVLTGVRLVALPGAPLAQTIYATPTLWHALHVSLYLHLVRGEARLVPCAWEHCRGPTLRVPRGERGEARQYCSDACKQAAYRNRRQRTNHLS